MPPAVPFIGSLNTEPGELPAPVLGKMLLVSRFWHVWFGGPVPDGLPLPAIAAGALTVANAAEVTRTATVLRKRASLRG
jgi:hypothetical protein